MRINTKQTFHLNEEEIKAVKGTQKILEEINNELEDLATWQIDDQIFDENIEEIIKLAVRLESKRIYSRFDEETKEKIRKNF